MHTRFILIETSHAGNVGAAARAMKVMGFDDLVLVKPRWPNVLRKEETLQRASGANDVLAKARVVDTLVEALDGVTHLCATAMTPRDFGPPTRSPREHFAGLLGHRRADAGAAMASQVGPVAGSPRFARDDGEDARVKGEGVRDDGEGVRDAGMCLTDDVKCARDDDKNARDDMDLRGDHSVAFLFGSERFGMKNEDVYRCHVALSIPTAPGFGSLNLAAALQVIAYEWRMALGGFAVQEATAPIDKADAQQVAGMLLHWEQALTEIGFLDPAAPKKLMPRLNQLFNRADLQPEEIHILRGVAKAMIEAARGKR